MFQTIDWVLTTYAISPKYSTAPGIINLTFHNAGIEETAYRIRPTIEKHRTMVTLKQFCTACAALVNGTGRLFKSYKHLTSVEQVSLIGLILDVGLTVKLLHMKEKVAFLYLQLSTVTEEGKLSLLYSITLP